MVKIRIYRKIDINDMTFKDKLDIKICDIFKGSDNNETVREFIVNSEEYFCIENEDIDSMCEDQLQDYIDFLNDLWDK